MGECVCIAIMCVCITDKKDCGDVQDLVIIQPATLVILRSAMMAVQMLRNSCLVLLSRESQFWVELAVVEPVCMCDDH